MSSEVDGKLRTLCVIDTVGRGGGAEQLVADLIPAMHKQGHKIDVLALFDWPDDLGEALEAQGIVVHRLHIGTNRSLPAGILAFRKILKTAKYNQFWGHLFAGNMFARLGQFLTPASSCAITLHSGGFAQSDNGGLKQQIEKLAHKLVLGRADKIVAVSGAVKDDFTRSCSWQKIEIIHNGVDVAQLNRLADARVIDKIRQDFNYGPNEFLITTVGRYVAIKGYVYLIEAAELLRDRFDLQPKFAFFGVGNEMDAIQQLICEKNLTEQISVNGVIDHGSLLPLLKASDLFVLPSLRETFGIAAAEAMAIGTPTILTKVGGFLELVGNTQAAKMVEAASGPALARAIANLITDPNERIRLGKLARKRIANNFDISVCATSWRELLSKAHTGRRA